MQATKGISNEQLEIELVKYRRLLERTARIMAKKIHDIGDLTDDILGAMLLGWTQARDEFDPSRGLKFVTLAMWCAKRQVLNLLRKVHPLGSTYWSKQVRKEFKPLLSLNHRIDGGMELCDTLGSCRRASERSRRNEYPQGLADSQWSQAQWQRVAGLLPQHVRHEFLLHFRDGVSFIELAERCGQSRANVYHRIMRACRNHLSGVQWLRDEVAA